MTWLIIITFLLAIVASAADGTVEGYEFDGRKSFERKYPERVKPNSFFGHLSWTNKTTLWYRITGGVWDFYHLADDIRSYGYRIAGMGLGGYVILLLLVQTKLLIISVLVISFFVVCSIMKRVSMWWIRN